MNPYAIALVLGLALVLLLGGAPGLGLSLATSPPTSTPAPTELPGDPHDYDNQIVYACRQNGLADPIWPLTVKAQIQQESSFVPDRIGDDGVSFGLMQINITYHPVDPHTLFDPATNINLGVQILAKCVRNWAGDWAAALRCYNGCVDTFGQPVACNDPSASDDYVRAIQGWLAPLAAAAGVQMPV